MHRRHLGLALPGSAWYIRPSPLSGADSCAVQGTLREALDRRRLQRGPQQKFLIPAIVLSLAHDVAAAMLHLHNEGVVHGDLKVG